MNHEHAKLRCIAARASFAVMERRHLTAAQKKQALSDPKTRARVLEQIRQAVREQRSYLGLSRSQLSEVEAQLQNPPMYLYETGLFEVTPRGMYVGPERDFGWIAAHHHFGDGAEYVRADTTPASAIEEVIRSRADYAVVPYESLKEGVIYPTVQAIAGGDLKLIAEREITQTLVLVGRQGEPADIERIFVSPQDHVACLSYLETSHTTIPVIDVRSPLAAMERALEEPGSAAIVPRGCTGPDGLSVVRENIGDDGEVRIRYGVVSRLPAPRSGHDVTAMLFTIRERPGALHDLLSHFKERSCNLRRIQSFPVPGEGWEYIFYIEVGGHITDRPLVSALEGAKQEAKTLKILGSFPLERPDASHHGSAAGER
jgi:chorismate mutase/prephenate dehydratase